MKMSCTSFCVHLSSAAWLTPSPTAPTQPEYEWPNGSVGCAEKDEGNVKNPEWGRNGCFETQEFVCLYLTKVPCGSLLAV